MSENVFPNEYLFQEMYHFSFLVSILSFEKFINYELRQEQPVCSKNMDAITDICSVRSGLCAYQPYTGRSYGADRILTIKCYKQYALNRA